MPLLQHSQFFTLVRREAGAEGKTLLWLCAAAGLLQGFAMFAVMQGLEELADEGVRFHTFAFFLLSLGGFYMLFRHSTGQAALIALRGMAAWRTRLACKLRGVSCLEYEALDKTLVHTALLDNHTLVVEAARMLMATGANTVMMLAAIGKMLTISVPGTLGVLSITMLGLFIFLQIISSVNGHMICAAKAESSVQDALRDMCAGMWHLKSRKAATTDIFGTAILPGLQKAANSGMDTEKAHASGISFFATFQLLVLGLLLFLMPGFLGASGEQTTSLLILTMFSLTPLMSFVSFIPLLTKVEMCLQRLQKLEEKLDSTTEIFERDAVNAAWNHPVPPVPDFSDLELRNIRFDYHDSEGNRLFGIEVEHFTLRRGEMVFIRGGNGSGKTTFMYVLAGLMTPQSGDIFINERPVSDLGMEAYRNMFTVLPSRFHLFRRPYGLGNATEALRHGLASMHLESKVDIDDSGQFTTLDLSSGQRKRLALLCATLEGRTICLFDEVAADFDPAFRRHFYESLLPDLRGKGITVVAISHDDRFFHVADRVLSMRDGRFEAEGSAQ